MTPPAQFPLIRLTRAGLVCVTLAATVGFPSKVSAAGQAGQDARNLVVLSDRGRQPLATTIVSGREMVSLEELATLFGLNVREDTRVGGLTVSYQGKTVVLAPGQGLASVDGRLVSLPTAPVRQGRTWLVPVEFITRAIAPIYDARLDLRRRTGLLVVGDLRVPQIGVEYVSTSGRMTITFDVDPATPYRVVEDPDRLLIRFDADALDVTLPAPPASDLVRAVRIGDTPTTIAVDAGSRLDTFATTETPEVSGLTRLVVEALAAATEVAPEAAPSAGGSPPAGGTPPTAPEPAPRPLVEFPTAAVRTVVIDAGHGGEEEGARGPGGALEKHITLSVARQLRSAIESRLGLRVIMTRESDETVRLDERAAVANNNKADIFISLHANASVRPGASGAEVFYLSVDDYGQEARRIASGEGEVLPVVGGGTRDIELILWEMAQVRHLSDSARLADIVEAELRSRVPMSQRAIQQAPFRVLVGANMPAVLVEMGFITNANEERRLTQLDHQRLIVQALVDSVVRFKAYREQQARRAMSLPSGEQDAGDDVAGLPPAPPPGGGR